MNISEIINSILNEEVKVGDFESTGGKWEISCFNRCERDIPHIHVFTAKHKKSAPRLDIADYFIHEDKRYKMNSKEKTAFDIFMSAKCKHNPELTNWQFCIIRWNETHPRKLSFELKNKPNYLNLPL